MVTKYINSAAGFANRCSRGIEFCLNNYLAVTGFFAFIGSDIAFNRVAAFSINIYLPIFLRYSGCAQLAFDRYQAVDYIAPRRCGELYRAACGVYFSIGGK